MTMNAFSASSLMSEILPLYISTTIFTLTALTLKHVLIGRPRLTLFRIGASAQG